MKPLVSILIPAFNAEQWIAAALNSAVSQTWERKEIIVVDDGSTDDTLAAARGFEGKTVKVVSQPNQGAAAARNEAFRICQGDYVQWLDADDVIAPDKIERQARTIGDGLGSRTLLSGPWAHFMWRLSKARFKPTSLWADLAPSDWMRLKLEKNLFMANSCWLLSRELTEKAGPWDASLTMDDDGEYFARVLMQSDLVKFVPGAAAFYRLPSGGNLSYAIHAPGKPESQFRSMKLQVCYARRLNDGEPMRAACLAYLQRWLFFFYPERADLVEQMRALAGELGGELDTPRLPSKYAFIRAIFGWPAAKRAQALLPQLRWAVVRGWDRTQFHLEKCFA